MNLLADKAIKTSAMSINTPVMLEINLNDSTTTLLLGIRTGFM